MVRHNVMLGDDLIAVLNTRHSALHTVHVFYIFVFLLTDCYVMLHVCF